MKKISDYIFKNIYSYGDPYNIIYSLLGMDAAEYALCGHLKNSNLNKLSDLIKKSSSEEHAWTIVNNLIFSEIIQAGNKVLVYDWMVSKLDDFEIVFDGCCKGKLNSDDLSLVYSVVKRPGLYFGRGNLSCVFSFLRGFKIYLKNGNFNIHISDKNLSKFMEFTTFEEEELYKNFLSEATGCQLTALKEFQRSWGATTELNN